MTKRAHSGSHRSIFRDLWHLHLFHIVLFRFKPVTETFNLFSPQTLRARNLLFCKMKQKLLGYQFLVQMPYSIIWTIMTLHVARISVLRIHILQQRFYDLCLVLFMDFRDIPTEALSVASKPLSSVSAHFACNRCNQQQVLELWEISWGQSSAGFVFHFVPLNSKDLVCIFLYIYKQAKGDEGQMGQTTEG